MGAERPLINQILEHALVVPDRVRRAPRLAPHRR
jgi:hypothetical protein